MGYLRGDGVTAVVYPGHDRIHELTLVGDHWLHSDLSRAAGTLTSSGYPFAYVRSDGVSSIVYNVPTGTFTNWRSLQHSGVCARPRRSRL
jgi:hypothetical protein